MSKHTPGPWVYGASTNYVGFYIAPANTLPTLAAVERQRGNPETLSVECFNFPGDTEANARLIAAAPDLLEALQLVKQYGSNSDTDDGESVSFYVDNAIAKAKGKH